MAHSDNKKQTKPEVTSLLHLNPLQTVLPPNAPAATPLQCTAVLDYLQLLKSHGYAFSTYIEKILKGQPILCLLLVSQSTYHRVSTQKVALTLHATQIQQICHIVLL